MEFFGETINHKTEERTRSDETIQLHPTTVSTCDRPTLIRDERIPGQEQRERAFVCDGYSDLYCFLL